jgi:hypothetical protein
LQKIILIALTFIFFGISVKAQESFSGGVHIGIPIASTSEVSSLNYGIDLTYLFMVSDNFEVGPTIGYSNFSGKDFSSGPFDVKVSDFGFVPIAARSRFSFNESFFGAADIGYAISVQGGTGGFYYQPIFGWQNKTINIFLFYKGIGSNGVTIASAGTGLTFRL